MMKRTKEAGCTRVYNGMSMMLFQALIAIELYRKINTRWITCWRSSNKI